MSIVSCKTFDLDKERPKVLLIGNGLTHDTGIPWSELIRRLARPGVSISDYEKIENGQRTFAVPNTVLMLAISETGDERRHARYVDVLAQESYPENEQLKELLSMPFDAVLTTNYTYELEAALLPKYPALGSKAKRRYMRTTTEKGDSKFLLHTFNRVGDGGPDIWHIHGELRRPSSLVLSHDEYARLVHEILAYNKSNRNRYVKERNELRFQTWIDYLILGDVYILGLGMDYAEFDLWWLLGRRLRERCDCGEIVFYEPWKGAAEPKKDDGASEKDKDEPKIDDSVYKQRALRDSGVEVDNCDFEIPKSGGYKAFYKRAIQDIRATVCP